MNVNVAFRIRSGGYPWGMARPSLFSAQLAMLHFGIPVMLIQDISKLRD
jgi:hypothetical protein